MLTLMVQSACRRSSWASNWPIGQCGGTCAWDLRGLWYANTSCSWLAVKQSLVKEGVTHGLLSKSKAESDTHDRYCGGIIKESIRLGVLALLLKH
jgi:hypothetical protein